LLDANLNFTASGKSVSELVGSIGGTGDFAMKKVDVLSSVKGSAFSGIYNLLSSLKQLGSSRSRNQTDVDATFQIDQGIARTNDLKLASQLGNGVAAGTVDLVGWLLNMEGQIQLHQSALTKILQAQSKRGVSPVGFTLTGPLDSPNVKVDTRGLLGGSVSIPGADVLLKKAPKKVQRILEGLFSIGEPFSPFPAPTNGTPIPPGSIQQQEPKKLNARDLLKELLR
jgi:AsmA protein